MLKIKDNEFEIYFMNFFCQYIFLYLLINKLYFINILQNIYLV